MRTTGTDNRKRISTPTAAATPPRMSAVWLSSTGNRKPGSCGPLELRATAASPRPTRRPRGKARVPDASAWIPCANSNVRLEKPRLCRTASSKVCRVSAREPTPASTARLTAPIWKTTSMMGTRRLSTRWRTVSSSAWSPWIDRAASSPGTARSRCPASFTRSSTASASSYGTSAKSRYTSQT